MARWRRFHRHSSKSDSGGPSLRSRGAFRLLSTIACLLLAGCYSYIEVRPSDLALGEEIRVHLSARERQRLRTEELFPYTTDSLEGQVTSAAGDTVGLLVPVRSREGRTVGAGVNQKLHLTPTGIVSLEVRRLDGVRSGILAGVGTGLVLALLTHQLNGWFGGDTMPPEPPKDP